VPLCCWAGLKLPAHLFIKHVATLIDSKLNFVIWAKLLTVVVVVSLRTDNVRA
jgi:hypothetical protein